MIKHIKNCGIKDCDSNMTMSNAIVKDKLHLAKRVWIQKEFVEWAGLNIVSKMNKLISVIM